MPLGDVSYQNSSLDALIGSWPASGATYRLFVSDPSLADSPADVELGSDGGYEPQDFAPADFAAAADGAASSADPISWGTSTDAFSDVGNYWGIVDTDGVLVYYDALDTPVSVSDDGITTTRTFTILFGQAA